MNRIKKILFENFDLRIESSDWKVSCFGLTIQHHLMFGSISLACLCSFCKYLHCIHSIQSWRWLNPLGMKPIGQSSRFEHLEKYLLEIISLDRVSYLVCFRQLGRQSSFRSSCWHALDSVQDDHSSMNCLQEVIVWQIESHSFETVGVGDKGRDS